MADLTQTDIERIGEEVGKQFIKHDVPIHKDIEEKLGEQTELITEEFKRLDAKIDAVHTDLSQQISQIDIRTDEDTTATMSDSVCISKTVAEIVCIVEKTTGEKYRYNTHFMKKNSPEVRALIKDIKSVSRDLEEYKGALKKGERSFKEIDLHAFEIRVDDLKERTEKLSGEKIKIQ